MLSHAQARLRQPPTSVDGQVAIGSGKSRALSERVARCVDNTEEGRYLGAWPRTLGHWLTIVTEKAV